MAMRAPKQRVAEPLICANHKHSRECRKDDEAAVLVECDAAWQLAESTIERRQILAFRRECLQAKVVRVCHDDAALVIDTNAARSIEAACRMAVVSELEQRRVIDRRPHSHTVISRVGDEDTISHMVDGHRVRRPSITTRPREPSISNDATADIIRSTDREQDREIERRQEQQSLIRWCCRSTAKPVKFESVTLIT